MVVYLAAPLFSQVERRWNREFAGLLAARAEDLSGEPVKVILPQDFRVEGRYNDRRRLKVLFEKCVKNVAAADAVVAVLDGPDTDSGVAFEMGYAYALGVPVVGVRTDFRQSQERGVNIMCSRPCSQFVCRMSFAESVEDLTNEVARKLVAAAGRGGVPKKRLRKRPTPRRAAFPKEPDATR